jgi:hypothetical protein
VKRTILLVLCIAACRSSSSPTTSTGGSSGSGAVANLPGAAGPRQAVERFLGAAKTGDIQELGIAWGTSKGPARESMERTELDKRVTMMAGCYDAEKHRILDEQPGEGGKRVLRVEMTKAGVTKTPRFTTVKGPSDRWYVEDADFAAITHFCKR